MNSVIDSWTLIHFLGWALVAFREGRRSHPIGLWVGIAVLAGGTWEIIEPLMGIHELGFNRLTDMVANIAGAITGWAILQEKLRDLDRPE